VERDMNKTKKTSVISVQDISVTIASFDLDDYIALPIWQKPKTVMHEQPILLKIGYRIALL
jgi:hypothetical protein